MQEYTTAEPCNPLRENLLKANSKSLQILTDWSLSQSKEKKALGSLGLNSYTTIHQFELMPFWEESTGSIPII